MAQYSFLYLETAGDASDEYHNERSDMMYPRLMEGGLL